MTPDSRLYRFGAVVCGLLALVAGWVAVTLGGAPKADFDVTGLLWVMQNGPRLLAMVVAATFAFWAVWCGIRARGR